MALIEQYNELKQQLRSQRDLFNQDHNTRLHRALSWLKAASEQVEAGNEDQAFINLWISFSACFEVPLVATVPIGSVMAIPASEHPPLGGRTQYLMCFSLTLDVFPIPELGNKGDVCVAFCLICVVSILWESCCVSSALCSLLSATLSLPTTSATSYL